MDAARERDSIGQDRVLVLGRARTVVGSPAVEQTKKSCREQGDYDPIYVVLEPNNLRYQNVSINASKRSRRRESPSVKDSGCGIQAHQPSHDRSRKYFSNINDSMPQAASESTLHLDVGTTLRDAERCGQRRGALSVYDRGLRPKGLCAARRHGGEGRQATRVLRPCSPPRVAARRQGM
ncbi:hypothetical protein BKA81DRAFT_397886 [Phyllosticta paracitricarpa]